jgi:hypothetical protein
MSKERGQKGNQSGKELPQEWKGEGRKKGKEDKGVWRGGSLLSYNLTVVVLNHKLATHLEPFINYFEKYHSNKCFTSQ